MGRTARRDEFDYDRCRASPRSTPRSGTSRDRSDLGLLPDVAVPTRRTGLGRRQRPSPHQGRLARHAARPPRGTGWRPDADAQDRLYGPALAPAPRHVVQPAVRSLGDPCQDADRPEHVRLARRVLAAQQPVGEIDIMEAWGYNDGRRTGRPAASTRPRRPCTRRPPVPAPTRSTLDAHPSSRTNTAPWRSSTRTRSSSPRPTPPSSWTAGKLARSDSGGRIRISGTRSTSAARCTCA